jgi:hypothetical protein
MQEIADDPNRADVWVAMADHFLDTETRHDIPLTAMRCIDAGLTIAEAREVWCYEISPAVSFNVWSVAGEWAGWDRAWLIERADRLRRRWTNAPGTARWLRYRIRVHHMHGVWVAIERCMEVLLRVDDPAERQRAALDLASLARHFFDFCPNDCALGEEAMTRLKSLYPEPFGRIMQPALVPREGSAAHDRVKAALFTSDGGCA